MKRSGRALPFVSVLPKVKSPLSERNGGNSTETLRNVSWKVLPGTSTRSVVAPTVTLSLTGVAIVLKRRMTSLPAWRIGVAITNSPLSTPAMPVAAAGWPGTGE
jgi:hypothetical protein